MPAGAEIEELEGPGGMRLRLIRTGEETGGELLEMEAHYPGDAPLPPVHLHPSQAERFEVLEGAVATAIDGVERTYAAGEAFDVPAGVPHQMTGDGPARVRWEVRPALRTAEFFRRLYRALAASDEDREDLGALIEEFRPEVRFDI